MSGKRTQPAIATFFSKKPRTAENPPKKQPKEPPRAPDHLSTKQERDAANWCSANGIPDDAGDCTAADFVKRDPALRPPNLFFLKHLSANPRLLREVIQTYATFGPYQPCLPQYPGHEVGGSVRSFSASWFEKHDWLEYSTTTDAVYCLCCYLSRNVMTKERELSVYAQPLMGYRNWKKAQSKSGFHKHVGQQCSKHHSANLEYENRKAAQNDVAVALQHEDTSQRLKNRKRLRFILDVCLLLAKQEIAFRGNDEKATSENKGNFLEFIEFTMQHDTVFAKAMSSAGANAMYTSPRIQHDLIQCSADAVRHHIIDVEIANGFYSVLVDEARCVAKKEHMSIVIRFVCAVTGTIKERFLGVVHVRDTSADTLFDALRNQLELWGLSLEKCRGQGYDGASNMAGDFNGLQRKFRACCPFAYYVHCFAHRLNLALVAVASNTISVAACFNTVQLLHTTVSASCKRKDQLLDEATKDINEKIDDGAVKTGRGMNQQRSTESLSKTRWNCRIRALQKVKLLWNPITAILERVVDDGINPEKRAEAAGALDQMWIFNFVFRCELLTAILSKTNCLSKYLQKDDVDITTAVNMVKVLVDDLENMQQNKITALHPASFESLWKSTATFCKKIKVNDLPHIPEKTDLWARRGRRSRGRGRAGIPGADASRHDVVPTEEQHYQQDVYMAVVKDMICELDVRFSKSVLSLLELSGAVSPRCNYKYWSIDSIGKLARDFYPDDFKDNVPKLLEEAEQFLKLAKTDKRFKNLKTTRHLCATILESDNSENFSLLHRFICLVCVLPVSTASTERSFPALNRIETRLRSSMGDLWLSNLMILAIERDITRSIDLDAVIDDLSPSVTDCGTQDFSPIFERSHCPHKLLTALGE